MRPTFGHESVILALLSGHLLKATNDLAVARCIFFRRVISGGVIVLTIVAFSLGSKTPKTTVNR